MWITKLRRIRSVNIFFFPDGMPKMPTDDTEKRFFLFVCFMCEKKRPEIALKEVTRFHFPSVNTNHLFSLLFLPLFHSPFEFLCCAGRGQRAFTYASAGQALRHSQKEAFQCKFWITPAGNNSLKNRVLARHAASF